MRAVPLRDFEQSLDFHRRVRFGFLEIAAREPERCAIIDATQDIDAIAAAIVATVTERLPA